MISQSWVTSESFHRLERFQYLFGKIKVGILWTCKKETEEELLFMMHFSLDLTY